MVQVPNGIASPPLMHHGRSWSRHCSRTFFFSSLAGISLGALTLCTVRDVLPAFVPPALLPNGSFRNHRANYTKVDASQRKQRPRARTCRSSDLSLCAGPTLVHHTNRKRRTVAIQGNRACIALPTFPFARPPLTERLPFPLPRNSQQRWEQG